LTLPAAQRRASRLPKSGDHPDADSDPVDPDGDHLADDGRPGRHRACDLGAPWSAGSIGIRWSLGPGSASASAIGRRNDERRLGCLHHRPQLSFTVRNGTLRQPRSNIG